MLPTSTKAICQSRQTIPTSPQNQATNQSSRICQLQLYLKKPPLQGIALPLTQTPRSQYLSQTQPIKQYKPTEENDETTIYYAFYITPDIPYGTYTGNNIHYDTTLNTTTVTLDGNGADSGEMGEYVVPAGKSFMLPQNIYTKTDYVFNGWNTEPSGTGTTYSDQANFVTPSTPENTTLYAQWAHATTISFDSNGSTGGKAMQPIIILAGDTKKLPTNSYTKEGYVLLEWNTERDGTGDFYADEAEFTADATESASITLYARWMKDGPYMQDVATWGNALSMGEEMTAIDKRDGKSYIVTRLADNNIWMTQNLDLDLRTDRILTPENTDVPENWAPANSTVRFTGYSIGDWVDNYDTPISADPGELYLYTSDSAQEDYKYTSLEDCVAAHPDCSMHNHIGNYYNWSAAVANNDTSGMTTLYDNAPDSICPAGWRLPTAIGNSHETSDLMVAEGIITGTYSTTYTTDGFTKIRRSPMWLIRPGFIRTGVLVNSLYHGGYWSSTINNGYWAYSMYVSLANHAYPASYDPTRIGLAVRCMAQ